MLIAGESSSNTRSAVSTIISPLNSDSDISSLLRDRGEFALAKPAVAATFLTTIKTKYAFRIFNNYIRKVQYPFKTPAPDRYRDVHISIQDLVRECRTGDLIMQGTNNENDPIGRVLVGITQSRAAVSHLMLIWRDPDTDIPYALTSFNWIFFPATLPLHLMSDYATGRSTTFSNSWRDRLELISV
ncbi:hypothetical protein QM012_005606 [Aureobasidium pullulans]|uniref:Uncharacterized protein n=1 Tax=Aureobasidium pullulans TaxID=5580 RepID=A0ABR0T5V3_AURPU